MNDNFSSFDTSMAMLNIKVQKMDIDMRWLEFTADTAVMNIHTFYIRTQSIFIKVALVKEYLDLSGVEGLSVFL